MPDDAYKVYLQPITLSTEQVQIHVTCRQSSYTVKLCNTFQLFSEITAMCRFFDLRRRAGALLPLVVHARCLTYDILTNINFTFSK